MPKKRYWDDVEDSSLPFNEGFHNWIIKSIQNNYNYFGNENGYIPDTIVKCIITYCIYGEYYKLNLNIVKSLLLVSKTWKYQTFKCMRVLGLPQNPKMFIYKEHVHSWQNPLTHIPKLSLLIIDANHLLSFKWTVLPKLNFNSTLVLNYSMIKHEKSEDYAFFMIPKIFPTVKKLVFESLQGETINKTAKITIDLDWIKEFKHLESLRLQLNRKDFAGLVDVKLPEELVNLKSFKYFFTFANVKLSPSVIKMSNLRKLGLIQDKFTTMCCLKRNVDEGKYEAMDPFVLKNIFIYSKLETFCFISIHLISVIKSTLIFNHEWFPRLKRIITGNLFSLPSGNWGSKKIEWFMLFNYFPNYNIPFGTSEAAKRTLIQTGKASIQNPLPLLAFPTIVGCKLHICPYFVADYGNMQFVKCITTQIRPHYYDFVINFDKYLKWMFFRRYSTSYRDKVKDLRFVLDVRLFKEKPETEKQIKSNPILLPLIKFI